jgi:lipopolysaccharide export system permease protein
MPYFIATTILAGLFIVLNTYIIPMSDKHRFIFEEKWVRDRKITETQNIREQIVPGTMLQMESFNYLDSIGYNLSMERFDNNKISTRIFASRLIWNKEKNNGDWKITEKEVLMETVSSLLNLSIKILYYPLTHQNL